MFIFKFILIINFNKTYFYLLFLTSHYKKTSVALNIYNLVHCSFALHIKAYLMLWSCNDPKHLISLKVSKPEI